MRTKVILEPQPEGSYVAYVPALPGFFSRGETRGEALENIRETIELYLETVRGELKRTRHELLKTTREAP